MVTNVVASLVISLITNVVESNNAEWVTDYSIQHAVLGPNSYGKRIGKPATERYLTTNIIERRILSLEHEGWNYNSTQDKLLSSVTAIQKLQETWKDAGFKTNTFHLDLTDLGHGFITLTNHSITR